MRALSNYRHPQTGFTLIELVMVIVILGILSAVAIPKFVDLRSDAQAAATQGVAGAISAGAAINVATRKANASKGPGKDIVKTYMDALRARGVKPAREWDKEI